MLDNLRMKLGLDGDDPVEERHLDQAARLKGLKLFVIPVEIMQRPARLLHEHARTLGEPTGEQVTFVEYIMNSQAFHFDVLQHCDAPGEGCEAHAQSSCQAFRFVVHAEVAVSLLRVWCCAPVLFITWLTLVHISSSYPLFLDGGNSASVIVRDAEMTIKINFREVESKRGSAKGSKRGSTGDPS